MQDRYRVLEIINLQISGYLHHPVMQFLGKERNKRITLFLEQDFGYAIYL